MNPAVLSIEAIAATAKLDAAPIQAGSAAPAGGFEHWVSTELNALNQQMVVAERGVQGLAAGSAVSVHDVMLQMEQARLSFQLAIQVRSKILEAYQDVMRMQV